MGRGTRKTQIGQSTGGGLAGANSRTPRRRAHVPAALRALGSCLLALGLLLAPSAGRLVAAATPIKVSVPVLVWLAPEDSEVQIFPGDFDWIGEEKISFESEVPMPEQTVYVPGADGEFEIDLSFDSPGNYRYDIKQTKGNESKEYIDATYHVVVFVTESDGLLQANVEVFLSEIDGKPESIVLPFRQKPEPEEPEEPDKPKPEEPKKPDEPKKPEEPKKPDEPTTPDTPTSNPPTQQAKSAKTGDPQSVTLWALLSAAAAAGALLLARRKVRSGRNGR